MTFTMEEPRCLTRLNRTLFSNLFEVKIPCFGLPKKHHKLTAELELNFIIHNKNHTTLSCSCILIGLCGILPL